jgi:hypothetical protein
VNLTDQEKADFFDLMEKHPGFRRLMLRVIQMAGIFNATANGSDQRTFYENGRRSLGLEILRLLEAAQPVQGSSGNPTLTMIQLLREEAQSPPSERTASGRRPDPYRDLSDGSDTEPGAE